MWLAICSLESSGVGALTMASGKLFHSWIVLGTFVKKKFVINVLVCLWMNEGKTNVADLWVVGQTTNVRNVCAWMST